MGPVANLIAVIFIFGGLLATVLWGALSWKHHRPAHSSAVVIASLVGFTFASFSALLHIATGAYARFHYFPFYDPVLMKIYRIGLITAALGFVISLIGSASRSPLRWKALALSAVMLLLWFGAAVSE